MNKGKKGSNIQQKSGEKSNKKLQKDMDNDVLWDTLEEKLNFPMILSNVFSMALFCLFFCELYEILVMGYGKNSSAQQGVVILGMVLFVISFVCAVLFQTGLLAFVMIGVIWFVNNMTYMIQGAKLEKGK